MKTFEKPMLIAESTFLASYAGNCPEQTEHMCGIAYRR